MTSRFIAFFLLLIVFSNSATAGIVDRIENLSLSKSDVIPKVIPGMIASVDIAGGKRSVLDYLLKPMRETASRALSEK